MNPNNWLLQVSDGCSDGPLDVWWIQLQPGDQTGRSCSYTRSASGEPGSQNPAPSCVGSGQESVSSPNLDGAEEAGFFQPWSQSVPSDMHLLSGTARLGRLQLKLRMQT